MSSTKLTKVKSIANINGTPTIKSIQQSLIKTTYNFNKLQIRNNDACMQSCHQHNFFNQLPMYLGFEFITIQFWSSFYYFTKYIYSIHVPQNQVQDQHFIICDLPIDVPNYCCTTCSMFYITTQLK